MKLRDHQCVFVRFDNESDPSRSQILVARLPAIEAMREGRFPGIAERYFAALDQETAMAVVNGFLPPEVATWNARAAYRGPQSSLIDVVHKGWEAVAQEYGAVDLQDLPMTTWTPQGEDRLRSRDIGGPVLILGTFHQYASPEVRRHMAGTIKRTLRIFQEAMEGLYA